MKKLVLLAAIAAVAILGCKKVTVLPAPSSAATTSFKENGRTWEGWDIHNPISKFDTIQDRILINSSGYYSNAAPSNAAKVLQGLALPNSGPRTVYAVEIAGIGNLNSMRSELSRRGYIIAPLSYFLSLAKEYGVSWGNNTALWNILCLDLPAKINFGTGPENAGVNFDSNIFNGQTQVYYNMELDFISESASFGSGERVLCLRKDN